MTTGTSFFDKDLYLAKKRREKWQSLGLMALGVLFFLNSPRPLFLPLFGMPAIVIGLVLSGWGYLRYQNYRRLPLHEALQLGQAQGGIVTRTDLFLILELTPQRTDQLIQALIEEGFIEPLDTNLPPEKEIRYRLIL